MAKMIAVDGNRSYRITSPIKLSRVIGDLSYYTFEPHGGNTPTTGAPQAEEYLRTGSPRVQKWNPRRRRRCRSRTLQAGALTTTFTASQGPPLMIPNMCARSRANSTRPCSYDRAFPRRPGPRHFRRPLRRDGLPPDRLRHALLLLRPECQDLALVAHASTLESRVPMMHFFDGFRTSHESDEDRSPRRQRVIHDVIDDKFVKACRDRAMTPDRPTMRGTAQNPDVYCFRAAKRSTKIFTMRSAIVQEVYGQGRGLHQAVKYHLMVTSARRTRKTSSS